MTENDKCGKYLHPAISTQHAYNRYKKHAQQSLEHRVQYQPRMQQG